MLNKTTAEKPLSWLERIEKSNEFLSRTCRIYNHLSRQGEENSVCPCGRLIRRHSYEGYSMQPNNELASTDLEYDEAYSAQIRLNVWGIYHSGCKYLRCDNNTNIKHIYNLIVADCGGRKPPFIISVYGGAKYFSLTDRLEKEFMRGIVHTATRADAWILTAGINNGVSKLVGEGISQYRLLTEYSKEVICIGLTMWGSVGEQTRLELRKNSANRIGLSGIVSVYSSYTPNRDNPFNWLSKQTLGNTIEDTKDMLEGNHTHCILFDNGRMYDYLTDKQRSQFVTIACNDQEKPCYSVTIIVEGGSGTLEILENDIQNERPIVLIQGSGRMADVIANVLELTTNVSQNQQREPTAMEIENAYLDKFPNVPSSTLSDQVKRITKLLKVEKRCFLNVFRLDRDTNIGESIFKAIFKVINYKKQQNRSDNISQAYNWKLINLALQWNYLDGAKQILESRLYIDKQEQQTIVQDIGKTRRLFEESLKLNRPEFIDYLLRAGFDPRNLSRSFDPDHCQNVIMKLYKIRLNSKTENNSRRVSPMFGASTPNSFLNLNEKLEKFLGCSVYPIYSPKIRNIFTHIPFDIPDQSRSRSLSNTDQKNSQIESSITVAERLGQIWLYSPEKEIIYSEQEMLRDLFLWSIFMDLPQMAKVLLAHLRARICGALIASAIFKRYAKKAPNIDLTQKFHKQAYDFEFYAARCVDQCYDYNERTACELLLREIPLFGKITCMQVAISSESTQFLETACFDHALNQVWYNKLALSNHSVQSKPALIASLFFGGLPAPKILQYRTEENRPGNDNKTNFSLSSRGIDYYIEKKPSDSSKMSTYARMVLYFHRSPIARMCYHFISYIFFLLVFSYMMLYHFALPSEVNQLHWTEWYVIITISTMLIEEIRRRHFDYGKIMRGKWRFTKPSILTVFTIIFYFALYILFYLGIGLRYGSDNNIILLTVARILLAFDLELWYLRSFKFVIALKFLGPKLFMLKNMLRDLFAFVYMIFIAIAAYGVVSRALVLHKQVPFDGRGIFGEIFYPPYWFIHGEISDKDMLDNLIENNTSTVIAEATATHIILALHMLFINILLLNLLIAVFADTIGKVQQNTEFYWRYQRYSFVQEYFEQPSLAYPPLIIIPHLCLLIYFIYKIIKKKCIKKNKVNDINNLEENIQQDATNILPIFKLIPVDSQSLDEYWHLFENTATLSYARSILEKKKQSSGFSGNRDLIDTFDEQKILSTNLDLSSPNIDENRSLTIDKQNTIDYLKEELSNVRSILTDVQTQLSQRNATVENLRITIVQMAESMKWIMDAMTRVKMSKKKQPIMDIGSSQVVTNMDVSTQT